MIEADAPTALILTALDLETQAVLRHLNNNWIEEVDSNGTVYYRGTFQNYDVVVVEAGAGNVSIHTTMSTLSAGTVFNDYWLGQPCDRFALHF